MAAYFQLINLVTGKADSFVKIDEVMCLHFDVPVNDNEYLCNWYNSIGFRVATGKSLNEICQEFITGIGEETKRGNENNAIGYANLLRIAQWLKLHYTTDSWYQAN